MSGIKNLHLPSLPFPQPLRGVETDSFARDTIIRRLPQTARQTLVDNDFAPAVVHRLQALLAEIPTEIIQPLNDPGAPDSAAWEDWCLPHLQQTWLEAPWFFVETYFYRRIIAAIQYFQQPEGQRSDPFARQKQAGLAAALQPARALSARMSAWWDMPVGGDLFEHIFHMVLWGNQADLSVWPVGRDAHLPRGKTGPILLIDENRLAAKLLPVNRVDFIIDNAGFELVCDLLAADILLQRKLVQKIVFHLKPHPTFVSDAMPSDARLTIDTLAADPDPLTYDSGRRLKQSIENGSLELSTDFFWTSPLSLWDLPDHLEQSIKTSGLVISKGDANYRRLLGDLRWDEALPFHQVVDYFPVPLMVLRVMKSDLVVGLLPEQIQRMDNHDPTWRINGQTGMIVTNLPK